MYWVGRGTTNLALGGGMDWVGRGVTNLALGGGMDWVGLGDGLLVGRLLMENG